MGMFHALPSCSDGLVNVNKWDDVLGGAQALDTAINASYQRRKEFIFACSWRMLVGLLEPV